MINAFNKSFSTLIAAIFLLAGTQEAGAWPSGSGGGLRLWGSSVDIDFTPVANGARPPVQWIYYDDGNDGLDGRYCVSGQVEVTLEDLTTTPSTATAWYEFVDDDQSTATTPGVCFSKVTQDCSIIVGASVGAGTAEECEYTVPSLDDVYATGYAAGGPAEGSEDVKNLLQGMMRVVPGTGTGFLDPPPAAEAEACDGDTPNKHCAIRFGFDFDGAPPTNFFPATVTDNLDPVLPNVTLFANEICTEFQPAHLLLDVTPAVEAKLEVLRSCEPLAMSLRVCTDINNSAGPKCDVDAGGGQQTTGSAHLLVGDFLNPEGLDVTCITGIEDLQGLEEDLQGTDICNEPVNLAACGDSNGLMEMPTTLLTGSCGDTSGESFEFNTPDGGGSVEELEVSSISSHGSPGFPGTSNIVEVSPDLMAIISTPASTEDNIFDFRDMFLLRVAYIDGLGGNDIIIGSKGPDTLRGSSGVDTLSGYLGNDVLQGGDGNDTLNGDCVDPAITDPMLPVADDCGDDGGDDLLLGYECFGPNADCSVALNKGAEVDTLYGGPGDDVLDGGRGNDILKGGDGKDAFVLWGDPDTDTMVDFDKSEDVIVNLTGNTAGIQWDGKRNSGVCKITVGGNNAIIDATITNANNCKIANLEDYDIRVGFPEGLGAGHPYTFE